MTIKISLKDISKIEKFKIGIRTINLKLIGQYYSIFHPFSSIKIYEFQLSHTEHRLLFTRLNNGKPPQTRERRVTRLKSQNMERLSHGMITAVG